MRLALQSQMLRYVSAILSYFPNESKLSVPTLLQLKCQPVRRLAFGIN